MASLHLLILLQFIISSVLQCSGLMSDYKTCGDQACARLMCRVQALSDRGARDCRFLSFKKGDMIDVYHKLRGKRSDLWAGSIDKQFGYFPKDAVKIDEVFVDEKMEIEMSTQRTDFFCMDAFGTIIRSDEEFEDYESEDLGNSDFDDRVSKASETNDKVKTRHIDNDNKDRGKPEQSRSSWIGSAFSGWFANDADEEGNGNKDQENFKSRKLALDLDQLEEEERQTKVLDWVGDGLTNTFGIGNNDLQANSKDKTENNEQSGYLAGNGIKNVPGFGGGDAQPSETEKLSQDENMQNLKEQQEATSLEVEDWAEMITENEKIGEKKDEGWYDSVYNRITNLYGDPSDKSEASKDEGKESLSDPDTNVDKVTISESEKKPESLLIQDSQSDRNTAKQEEKQEVTGQDHSDETAEGWYGSVYNTVTGFYGDSPDGKDAPDKSDVTENSRGDRQETPETADMRASRDEKLENGDHAAEKMNENDNAGWYGSVYTRISNMYGETSDENDVPDVMKDVESQRQGENSKDTSSPSIFSMNVLTSVIDGLRSPSKGAGSDDETNPSESVTSEPNLTQSHVSNDQTDAMTLKSDDDDTEDPGLNERENTDNLKDADQSQDASQSIFNVNHLSTMINGLKSPFKSNDAGDKEVSDGEETPDTGKEDDDDKSDNDDELSVRSTDVISEMSNALGNEQEEEEEEEVVQEVNVTEAQNNTVESSVDCDKQDDGVIMSGDGENISTDIHVDVDEFSELSDSGPAHLSTDQHKDMKSELNTDETLTEEPSWTELAEHVSDASKSHEDEANTHDVNRVPEKKNKFTDSPGEEDPQPESETGSDSGLQVRTDVTENNSETVDESDEAQDEGGAADMLPETEDSGMNVRSSEVVQTIHTASKHEKDGVDVTQMESGGEREGGESNEKEHWGKIEGLDVTQMESGGEKEDTEATQMGSDLEKETLNITQMETGGEKEGGVTQMEYSGGQEDGDVAQMEFNVENKSIDIIQLEYARGENDTHQTESGGDENSGEVTQVEHAGGEESIGITQIEIDGEEESIDFTQTESGGEKEGGVTQMEYSGGQEDGDVAQMESGGEKESLDVTQGGDLTQVASDGEKEGINITQKEPDGEKGDVDLIQKQQPSLQTAHIISETKQNLELDPDDSREPEKRENAAAKQAEIIPKNIRDKSPSAHGSETQQSSMSDGNQNEHVREKDGDKMMDVKYQKARTSAQTQKSTHPNLQAHLSEEDLQDLLKFFGAETLTWLDFITGHSEYNNNEELAELHDFEQTLEHLLKNRDPGIKPSLQTIQTVLAMLRKKFKPMIADGSVDKSPDLRQTECVSEVCVSKTENMPISEQDMGKDNNLDNNLDNSSSINDWDGLIGNSLSDKSRISDDKDALESDQITAPQSDANIITEEFLEPEQSLHGVLRPYKDLVAEFTSDALTYVMKEGARVKHAMHEVVMSLPDDIRPGPDLYGLPWEAVIFTATLGLFTFLLFSCRFVQAIKSRLYCSKERRMGQKVAELLEEKCKVLEALSECEHKFKKLETALQNGGLSAQDSEREDLEAMSKKLEEAYVQMKSDMKKKQEELDTHEQLRKQQEEQLTKLEEMLKKLEEEATERKSQLEQEKTTVKIHEMNTERLQKKLQEVKEENGMLLESKAQLEQEAEGWKERLNELEEEKRMSETSHNRMMENCVNKDERIKSLTDCLLKMRDWDSEEESAGNNTSGSENNNSSDFMQKQKVQKLINAAKMSADLKAMEEDRDRVFAKLTDEIKAKEDLQVNLEQLQHERESLESESSTYSSEIEKLQHKLQIMSEMYQEKELKLHRMLTVEEKERSQKEEQLNKAGKKISLATDELNSYRQRAKELEEELEKTNQAYRNQIGSHEKKAHDNWLAARAADRDLAEVKRENSVLRQRLTDWQFKLELMEKNPQARAPLVRGERSPFGPSPLGRPPSETRPFLSPPTLMDGPPRVSPQFPMMPGGRAPPGGAEGDRSVSYSEGGSPTWERERERERRSLGPPGPDPGLVYRRPPSAPFLRAPLPPEAYFNEKSDSSFGGEGAGFRENGIRDSGRPMPGADIRAGPLPPPPFPPVDPRDPHFPRLGYRPDFFPRPLAMRGPPPPLPPGVFPRIPLPPHMVFPPMRPPADNVSPEPPSRPSPPGSEQSPEQPASTHDII